MPPALLEVIDLEKRYGATLALSKVSFQVHEKEIFGLLGPNGAGKTTLLSIVCGLLAPTSGDVKLAGRSLLGGDDDLKRQIGIVPQELAIYGELTARENLQFFGEIYSVSGSALQNAVDEVLAAIGL